MSKKANPTLIGAFVVGAVVLVFAAIAIIGSGQLFRKTYEFVLYFEGSVSGLREGASVKYKGVEIGTITSILLQLGDGVDANRIPVIIKLDANKISGSRGVGGSLTDPAGLKAAIDRGLRGQLQTESIVTGVLFVALDLFPDSPIKFVQPPGSRYQEIPTIPTTLQKVQDILGQLLGKLDDVDFKQLLNSVTDAVKNLEGLANNKDLQGAFAGVNQLVNKPELHAAVRSLDETVRRISQAADGVQKVAGTLDRSVATLSVDLKETLTGVRDAVKQIQVTVANADGFVDPNSPTAYELTKALKELSGAARSLRLMADFLERNPRALLFGRPESEKQ
ncbi:MAG TPA: MlaD family protein [Candidatus Binatia bacterium]|nr:MlaD family protein [Candidatus Binatia bacterium]